MYEIPIKCAVAGCGNSFEKTGLSVEYHPFPIYNEDLLAIWLMKCVGEENIDPPTSFVCSKHFSRQDYDASVDSHLGNLRSTAYPTRHLGVLSNWLDANDPVLEEEEPVNILDLMFNQPCKVVPVPNVTSGPSHGGSNDRQDPAADKGKTQSPSKLVKGLKVQSSDRRLRGFCRVATCRARVVSGEIGFHSIPQTPHLAKLWVEAALLDLSTSLKHKILCRRHFTTNDYLEPIGGKPPRLRRGAVPSQNLPENHAVVRLAKAKLKQDSLPRNKVYRTCSLEKQFSDIPELAAAFEEYKREMRIMGAVDPIPLPVIRHDLLGPGEPIVSDRPYVKAWKKKVRTPEEEKQVLENRKQLSLRRRLQMRQLNRRMPRKCYYSLSRSFNNDSRQNHHRRGACNRKLIDRNRVPALNSAAAALNRLQACELNEENIEEEVITPEHFVDHSYGGCTVPSTGTFGDDIVIPSSPQPTEPLQSFDQFPDLFDSLGDDLRAMPEFDARVRVRDMMNRYRADFKRQSLDIRSALLELHRVDRKLSHMKLNLANAIAAEFENVFGRLPPD